MNLKKPLFWDLPKPNFISFLLIPFSFPIILRNYLYKFIKKEKSSKIKTICVGNIYLGGTGKTPLTISIYEMLKERGYNVATVKKYYSNQKDEQLLLKRKTSSIISNSRKEALKIGLNKKYDTLIFDDGLQDIGIEFDIKLVCFKSINWIGNGQLIPAGPLREKISSLKKFDAVFLNGYSEDLDNIENEIKKINPNIQIFRTYYKISNINKYDLSKKYLIYSGIGNPSDFKDILIENNFNVSKEIIFSDHYKYNIKDFEKIIKEAKEENLKILTTEKDHVKVPAEFKKEINFLSIDLVIDNNKHLIELLNN